MTQNSVKLIVNDGINPDKDYVFDEPVTHVFGRGRRCTLCIPNIAGHQDISRRHCRLVIDPPKVWIEDLASRNGTFVNDNLLRPGEEAREVHDGDEIRLGDSLAIHVELLVPAGSRSS